MSSLNRTSTIITIVGTVVGMIIAYLSLAAAVKWPPFSESGSVIVYKGHSAQNQAYCTGAACAFVGVEVRDFPADTAVRCTFDSSVGTSSFVDMRFRTNADGGFQADSTNYFGNPGGWVSVTCNDVHGELNPW